MGATPEVFVAIDWTDFDDDDHTTLCVSLITTHGRATPLAWRTVKKSKLKNRRTRYELEMVERVYDFLPRSTHVTWLGDRAFGYRQMREAISRRGHDYILRFRENVMVQDGDAARRGEMRGCFSTGKPAEAAPVPYKGRGKRKR